MEFVEKKEVEKLALLKHLIGKRYNKTGNYINGVKVSQEGEEQHLANLYDILHKNTENKYIEEHFAVEELLPRELVHELAKVEQKH